VGRHPSRGPRNLGHLARVFPVSPERTWAGYWAPKNLCLLLRGAPQVSPEYGIYDFLAGAAAVTL
jgi:hypothetical protein